MITERIAARVPVTLADLARAALGRPDATDSEIMRAGLAALAGVDVRDYTPRMGRPPRNVPQERVA